MAYYTYTKDPIGCFVERDTGNYFEYSVNDDPLNNCNEDTLHKIWVGGSSVAGVTGYCYGTVKKTARDLMWENGGPGVYSCDFRKSYMLNNDDHKFDIIPEIMNINIQI